MHEEADDLVADAYVVLGLSEDASVKDVRTAYDAALRNARKGDHVWERTKEITRAFELLTERLSDGTDTAKTFDTIPDPVTPSLDETGRVRALLFPPPTAVNPLSYWPRVCFFIVLIAWGVRFIFAPVEGDPVLRSFMHLIDLPFHEAGHVIFSFLGDFLHVLGGSLNQVLVPVVCMVAFLRRAEPFSASCALWWTGQNFIDLSPYIYDARAGELMLLGGVTGQYAPDFHDWHNMLGRLGLLSYDHVFAYASKCVGVSLIVLSLVWGGWALARQYARLRRDM
jgi:hypothetical protein